MPLTVRSFIGSRRHRRIIPIGRSSTSSQSHEPPTQPRNVWYQETPISSASSVTTLQNIRQLARSEIETQDPSPSSPKMCTVCYVPIDNSAYIFNNRCRCTLTYCKPCIIRWVLTHKNTCPTCRQFIFRKRIVGHIRKLRSIYVKRSEHLSDSRVVKIVKFIDQLEALRHIPTPPREPKTTEGIYCQNLRHCFTYRYYNRNSFPYVY